MDLIDTQLDQVSSFRQWLDEQIDAGRDFGGLPSTIKGQLLQYLDHIESAKQVGSYSQAPISNWVLVKSKVSASDKYEITVTGPAPTDSVHIDAKDDGQARFVLSDQFVGYISSSCQRLLLAAQSLEHVFELRQMIKEEKSSLSQCPRVTVRDHIRLLKQYNDIKDVGQQLIGLIAENRGVSIGSLYKDAQFGVTSDD